MRLLIFHYVIFLCLSFRLSLWLFSFQALFRYVHFHSSMLCCSTTRAQSFPHCKEGCSQCAASMFRRYSQCFPMCIACIGCFKVSALNVQASVNCSSLSTRKTCGLLASCLKFQLLFVYQSLREQNEFSADFMWILFLNKCLSFMKFLVLNISTIIEFLK